MALILRPWHWPWPSDNFIAVCPRWQDNPIEVESATSELASQEVEPASDGGTGDGR